MWNLNSTWNGNHHRTCRGNHSYKILFFKALSLKRRQIPRLKLSDFLRLSLINQTDCINRLSLFHRRNIICGKTGIISLHIETYIMYLRVHIARFSN